MIFTMRINRNSRRNAYRNAMRTNASRRRINCATAADYDREELVDNYGEDEADMIIEAAQALGYSAEKVSDRVNRGAWFVFPSAYTAEDVAEQYLDFTAAFDGLPEQFDWMVDYLDTRAYGENLITAAYSYKGDGFYVLDLINF